jgi:hypothetical protein
MLLFFVLFYVYPLKFLFSMVFSGGGQIEANEARVLFVIYGAGFAAISLVFALLYVHAWKHREELALNGIERLRTRHTLVDHLAMVIVGLASATLAWTVPGRWVPVAGWFYFLIGVYYTVAGTIYGNRERVLKEKMAAISAGIAESEE